MEIAILQRINRNGNSVILHWVLLDGSDWFFCRLNLFLFLNLFWLLFSRRLNKYLRVLYWCHPKMCDLISHFKYHQKECKQIKKNSINNRFGWTELSIDKLNFKENNYRKMVVAAHVWSFFWISPFWTSRKHDDNSIQMVIRACDAFTNSHCSRFPFILCILCKFRNA